MFFDADCNAQTDPTGAVETTFSNWYDYDLENNTLAPMTGTWLVTGGTGKLYKVQLLTYYASPDGGMGESGGRYTMKVEAL
jgi:hypothetical protein